MVLRKIAAPDECIEGGIPVTLSVKFTFPVKVATLESAIIIEYI